MSGNKQLKMPIKRISGLVDAIPSHLSNIEQKDQLKIRDIVYSQFTKCIPRFNMIQSSWNKVDLGFSI